MPWLLAIRHDMCAVLMLDELCLYFRCIPEPCPGLSAPEYTPVLLFPLLFVCVRKQGYHGS